MTIKRTKEKEEKGEEEVKEKGDFEHTYIYIILVINMAAI